jgi:hypothetical protein
MMIIDSSLEISFEGIFYTPRALFLLCIHSLDVEMFCTCFLNFRFYFLENGGGSCELAQISQHA